MILILKWLIKTYLLDWRTLGSCALASFLWVSRHLILQRREGIRDQVSDLTSNTSNKFSTKVICWTLCAKKNCSAKCQHKRTGKFLNSILYQPIFEQPSAATSQHESSELQPPGYFLQGFACRRFIV